MALLRWASSHEWITTLISKGFVLPLCMLNKCRQLTWPLFQRDTIHGLILRLWTLPPCMQNYLTPKALLHQGLTTAHRDIRNNESLQTAWLIQYQPGKQKEDLRESSVEHDSKEELEEFDWCVEVGILTRALYPFILSALN